MIHFYLASTNRQKLLWKVRIYVDEKPSFLKVAFGTWF